MRVADIREEFRRLLTAGEFIGSRGVSNRTLEIIGASFIADDPAIVGKFNAKYFERELGWYGTMSQSLADFPGGAPKVWLDCAATDRTVNSNYGWCLFSEENGSQYASVLAELRIRPWSRRAVAIYTRPSMHIDATAGGRDDFMCTNAVQYFVRDGRLSALVQMRSNDAHIGYKNDRAWQLVVLHRLADDLNVGVDVIRWQVGTLHLYERDWNLL